MDPAGLANPDGSGRKPGRFRIRLVGTWCRSGRGQVFADAGLLKRGGIDAFFEWIGGHACLPEFLGNLRP